jgi:hypothetical protein
MKRNKQVFLALFVLVAVASLFTACKVIGAGSGSDLEEDGGNSALSVKAISAFSVTSPVAADGVIDETGHTIAVSVPSGTDITGMTVTFEYSGASAEPLSGTTLNFTEPKTFTVTAADGSKQQYTVTVDVGGPADKEILSFSITEPPVVGVISGTDISVNVPFGTSLDSLTASIIFSGDSVSPASGEAVDFSESGANPQTFTVTAADGSTAEYTVTVATNMITGVSVSPATPTVTRGTSQAFTADVTKTGNPATTVTWGVDSVISSIDPSGVLTVPVAETASTLTVTATSTANPGVSGAATVTVTDLYSQTASGTYEWEVPEDGDYVIELTGASGGNGYGAGGKGGIIKGTISLTAGTTYEIKVGGAGENRKNGITADSVSAGGFNGGGNGGPGGPGGNGGGAPSGAGAGAGGGATDIRTPGGNYTTRMMVAGGGGGGAKKTNESVGQPGGNAGNGNGGSGASGVGSDGGAGATMAAKNANGVGSNGPGPIWNGYEAGGGGGGGYYGAAAGGATGGGGGGGSSWANTGDGMFFDVTPAANGGGARSGNGSVRIIALMRQ